jgi:hypothetical protein
MNMSTCVADIGHRTYLNKNEWIGEGIALSRKESRLKFEIADWLISGEELFGETCYADAARIFGRSYDRLRHIASVARRVCRARHNLSWRHHEAVASLPHDKQEAYLDYAESNHLDSDELRDHIAFRERGEGTDKLQRDERACVRKEGLRLLAEHRGVSVEELKTLIIDEYLSNAVFEIEDARADHKMSAGLRCDKARERSEKRFRAHIDEVLHLLVVPDHSGVIEPDQFTETWKRLYGKEFSLNAYKRACNVEEFITAFDTKYCTQEDFGFEPARMRLVPGRPKRASAKDRKLWSREECENEKRRIAEGRTYWYLDRHVTPEEAERLRAA